MVIKREDIGKISEAVSILRKYIGRPDFNICEPKQSKKAVIEILKKTGDKIAAEDEIEKFLKLMMDSCQVGSAKGAIVAEATKRKKSSTGKKMSGWICYNKVCAKETGRNYMTCVTDADRKEKEYIPKKEYWRKHASGGCTRAGE